MSATSSSVIAAAAVPPRLQPGDRVRFVSPSSPPDRDEVEHAARVVAGWGLRVEIGAHAFDRHGHYLAGRDEDRLADLNDALRDPGVRAVFSTRGGKGAYRIADGIDVEAVRRDPKPLIGYSDTTVLHLARWQRAGVGGFHGPPAAWREPRWRVGAAAQRLRRDQDALRRALMEPEPIVIRQDPSERTAAVTMHGPFVRDPATGLGAAPDAGVATGVLMGGTLGVIATAVGWACPSFSGAILFIEAIDNEIGQIDRALTQLRKSGRLDGLAGVAVGQFIRCAEEKRGKWSALDVLQDHLSALGVPVLGGLPIGHDSRPSTFPLGTRARLETRAGTLTIEPGVR